MSPAVVPDRRGNGAKGGLGTPREVNVYVTSRLNAGEKSLRLHIGVGIIIAGIINAYSSSIDRASVRSSSSSRASRRQYLPTSRYNFESNEEKRRSRVHGANVT